jgi:hypothetical protein
LLRPVVAAAWQHSAVSLPVRIQSATLARLGDIPP